MAWEQLSINKPHLVYLILGGFTSLFMLCSLVVKERLYIGEATVATICGIIFGPHAANLIDPGTWGNTDQITLEFSRIVLVVQCFAVGVELPKSYMERHWRSVIFLLLPVMTFGWLVTSLVIWWMVPPLDWLESLCCAACVTATDPVLASSVVGKGKFAKRVPKHLRDLLSAESGCNDGMAFPFIYLALYLIRYRPDSNKVAFHWICFTILYECIWGAVYGFLVGYFARHAIKWAEKRALIDRESFLVFYFVLALFCAGSGSLLGMDDLLIGFSAGVGFSNDGWFTQKTEESHVSNVIDLLLNLAYFVYLGTIIPWGLYNAPQIGLTPWRLVVISVFVILFRRIPIMMALKPIIPDVKTWREALFAGHFGPIGVGAIFVAVLARAELEGESTTPLAELPAPGTEHYALVQLIWAITTFLVISSILVHGSSIAVFTLGKRINTLTITMSYTQVNEDGPSWMNRLPRIQSVAKNSMSKSKDDFDSESLNEKLAEYPPGTLPPIGMPGNFLRRQKEEDNPSKPNSRASSQRPAMRRKRWDSGLGPGGPISQSAIVPQRRAQAVGSTESPTETLNEKTESSPDSRAIDDEPDGLELQESADRKRKEREGREEFMDVEEPPVKAYQEGSNMVIEDSEGNVLSVVDTHDETDEEKNKHIQDQADKLRRETSGEHSKGKNHPHEKNEGEEIRHAVQDGVQHPYRNLKKRLGTWHGLKQKQNQSEAGPPEERAKPPPERKRGPAHAYQFGNTIIVEDEDGEVVKKYQLPTPEKKKRGDLARSRSSYVDPAATRQRLHRMGTWVGLSAKEAETEAGPSDAASKDPPKKRKKSAIVDDDDDRIRFTVNTGGRRMNKEDFIRQIQQLDPKARCEAVQNSDVPEEVKQEARDHAREHKRAEQASKSRFRPQRHQTQTLKPFDQQAASEDTGPDMPQLQRVGSDPERAHGPEGLTLVDSHGDDIPYHSVPDSVAKHSTGPESAAQRRRRLAASSRNTDEAGSPERDAALPSTLDRQVSHMAAAGETRAERRRRLAALGGEDESDSDDDGAPRRPKHAPVPEPNEDEDENEGGRRREKRAPGIRFADTPAVSQGRVQWGEDVGRRGRRS